MISYLSYQLYQANGKHASLLKIPWLALSIVTEENREKSIWNQALVIIGIAGVCFIILHPVFLSPAPKFTFLVYTSLSEIKADLLTVLTGNLMTPNTAHGMLPLPGKHRRSSRRSQHTQEDTPCRKGSRALSQWAVCLGGPSQGPGCRGACIRAPLRVDIYSASLSKSRFKLVPITHPQHRPRCGSEPLL